MNGPSPLSLNEHFAIPGQLTFVARAGGLPLAELRTPDATAQVALQGAQVLAFHPQGSAPVLFLSRRAIYAPATAIRGGIPLCWPWFGPHPTDPTKPQHGFVRTAAWSVLASGLREDGAVWLRLELTDSPTTRALWPYPFRLTLTVTVSRALRVELEVHNPGDAPLACTEALHTYYHVGSVTATAVQGLEGVAYADKVDDGRRKYQAGPVTVAGETDRVYLDAPPACVIDDAQLQRRIHVTTAGSHSTVIWNPWVEKGRQMRDFGADEYAHMLCVEVGNALDNQVVVAPGDTHQLLLTTWVEPVA